MVLLRRRFWQGLLRRRQENRTQTVIPAQAPPARESWPQIDMALNDPLLVYFQHVAGVVEIEKLELDSPALRTMKAAGVKLAVPLISQGDLIGILNLGPRMSDQEYSSDDRRLLNDLATQAAPALRVAQLARQQQAEAAERERIEQELRVARLIQQTLLPKEVPHLPSWELDSYYQPARAVGGDFYDFYTFPDGRIGIVIGDVTDKGVPAALVMATTRSILRAASEQSTSPGKVLEQANNRLCPDIPAKMFVTCFYAILDPANGQLWYANAGHDLPYHRASHVVSEVRATGMPLGLLPGMEYEENQLVLAPGDQIIFYSDGLVEAHSNSGEMFGFPRLQELIGLHDNDEDVIKYLLGQLGQFVPPDWEQEDDVTLVILQRLLAPNPEKEPIVSVPATSPTNTAPERVLASLQVPSQAGNERQAMEQVAASIQALGMSQAQIERLKTAVAEATMNAMEHGNGYQPELPVEIVVRQRGTAVIVEISDQGGGGDLLEPEVPDIEAKLAGMQTPRGWGLFLIQHMVDELRTRTAGNRHVVELVMKLEGAEHAGEAI